MGNSIYKFIGNGVLLEELNLRSGDTFVLINDQIEFSDGSLLKTFKFDQSLKNRLVLEYQDSIMIYHKNSIIYGISIDKGPIILADNAHPTTFGYIIK